MSWDAIRLYFCEHGFGNSRRAKRDAREDTDTGVDRYVVVQVLRGKDGDSDGLVRSSGTHNADGHMLLDVCESVR